MSHLQLLGFMLKISCATPVLGPTMGLVGVGLANVLAGQASKHTRKMVVTRSHPLAPGFWEAPNPEDMVLDAVMGACIFKVTRVQRSKFVPFNSGPILGWICAIAPLSQLFVLSRSQRGHGARRCYRRMHVRGAKEQRNKLVVAA